MVAELTRECVIDRDRARPFRHSYSISFHHHIAANALRTISQDIYVRFRLQRSQYSSKSLALTVHNSSSSLSRAATRLHIYNFVCDTCVVRARARAHKRSIPFIHCEASFVIIAKVSTYAAFVRRGLLLFTRCQFFSLHICRWMLKKKLFDFSTLFGSNVRECWWLCVRVCVFPLKLFAFRWNCVQLYQSFAWTALLDVYRTRNASHVFNIEFLIILSSHLANHYQN